jgi:hypothetical protein
MTAVGQGRGGFRGERRLKQILVTVPLRARAGLSQPQNDEAAKPRR